MRLKPTDCNSPTASSPVREDLQHRHDKDNTAPTENTTNPPKGPWGHHTSSTDAVIFPGREKLTFVLVELPA